MVRVGRHYWKFVLCSVFVVSVFMVLRNVSRCTWVDTGPQMVPNEKYIVGEDQKVYRYHREMPLIFIGGVPRSGTTLMRAMLDAHPEVRCGQETRVIPRLLQIRSHWLKSQKESLRLEEAGLHKDVLDSAIAAFCLEIIAKHGDPAPRLCNKDPLTLKSASYLSEIFPASKFILMVRDGRATVHSIISRKVTITGFDLKSYRQCLTKWNNAIQTMHNQCKDVGSSRCMMVYYEQLVLHPKESMHKILEFLDVPWNDSVLHHEEQINKPGGVSLSNVSPHVVSSQEKLDRREREEGRKEDAAERPRRSMKARPRSRESEKFSLIQIFPSLSVIRFLHYSASTLGKK
ncbi:UNVERIFIED_CONTAM: hypothetical protein PYX00_005214 [Menopon gallinae]|uniref:Protein-tyrosine sulfotransferase n=1 Tax=Menopon gallinae TaxID=328185 RepID=A0AAW2HQG7_9NEOP